MTNVNDKKKFYSYTRVYHLLSKFRRPRPRRNPRCGNRIWPALHLILFLLVFSPLLPFKAKAATGTYTSLSMPADVNANTATPVFVMADDLSYDNQTAEIFGEGHGTIKHDDIYIFADRIYANVNTGDISADGNVLVMQKDSRIYTDKIYYNFKTPTAYTENVTIVKPPWIVKGKKMKTEGKKTEIESPVFTTCDKEQPHYRMESSIIYIYQDDKIEAWNTVFYLGRIPVLYFPYFYQSLKNNKLPFEIKVGHNDIQGYYADLIYNYYFNQLNQETLEVDYMQKLGWGYRLTSNYGFSKDSTGSLYGYYTKTTSSLNSQDEHWEGSLTHTQQFNDTSKLNIKVSKVSDALLSQETLAGQVDNQSQNSYADFTTSFWGNNSLDINALDTETLVTTDPLTGQPLDKSKYHYITTGRTLPYLNYQMTSLEILPRLYLKNSLNFTRNYSLSTPGYYSDNAGWNPNLTLSLPRLLFMSLSGGAGLQSNWSNSDEKSHIKGEFLNTYTTNATLVMDIAPRGVLQLTLSQNLAKQINKNKSMLHTGITADSLAINMSSMLGMLTIRANTTYDMLDDSPPIKNIQDRFSLLALNATMNYNEYSLYANSGYSIYANMVKNTDVNFAMGDKEKSLWSMNLGTTYVNNLIDTRGYPQLNIKDTFYFNTGLNFAFTDEFSIGATRQYDMITKRLMDHSYSVTWHLHCWDASFSWSKRQDNVEEVYFSINISALPQYKLTKPTTIAPSINPQLGTQ